MNDRQPETCRISAAAFQALAEQVLRELPEPLRRAAATVDLVTMDRCPPGLRPEDDDEECDLLGLYDGPTLGELHDDFGPPSLSPRLYLFRHAHEESCGDVEELAAELRITVIHELGHHLGFDEAALDAMGLG
jgi:predicted Zn-dependent protease with MMP-like domain